MNGISRLKDITIKFILSLPVKKFNWYSLSKNSAMKWEMIQANPNLPWMTTGLSANPNITKEVIENNPHIDFDYFYVTSNVSWEYIFQHLDKSWNWYEISLNKVDWDIVQKNPDLPWKWSGLSLNISIEIILENIEEPWDWNKILINRTLTFEQNEKILQKIPFIYKHVTTHHILTTKKEGLLLKDIDNFWVHISSNPYIDASFVLNNIDKNWSYPSLSSNPFFGDRERVIERVIERVLIAHKNCYKDIVSSI